METTIGGGYWAGPVYGAPGWEPIYAFVGKVATPYDPAKEAQYIAEDDLTTSGGCGWASCGSCDNSTTSGASIAYPYMTATMFTDYLGSGCFTYSSWFSCIYVPWHGLVQVL